MITRDYILQQIHRLIQALAQVTLKRQAEQYDDATDLLSQTSGEVTGLELQDLRQSSNEILIGICSVSGELVSEKAIAIADLLLEDSLILCAVNDDARAAQSRQRVLWLYEAALCSGGIVPFDLPNRLEKLKAQLQTDHRHLS